jgi:hypothetical protein
MAEAYWDLEWELQQQGFDYCYDKRLYDRLEKEGAESVRLHLQADMAYQEKLVRFIENHDEPRALSAFSPQKASRGQKSSMKGSSWEERSGFPSSSAAARTNRSTLTSRVSTARF